MRRLAVLVLLLAAGCGSGDDVAVSPELEQQRTDVRTLTRTLVDSATTAVGASVRSADARWKGCRSAFNDTYASYRYAAQVRLDATAEDLLGGLGPAVGLAPSEPDKLRGTVDGLDVSFWALPAGSQGALLLTVQGPCVDVPEDQRDAWRDRREESPDPLQD